MDARGQAAEAAARALAEGGISDAIRGEIATHHALAEKMQHEADLITQEIMVSVG